MESLTGTLFRDDLCQLLTGMYTGGQNSAEIRAEGVTNGVINEGLS